ncbi:tRNA uracil 4-sulfurtransferase ThiI [Cellulosilyticum sp. WCF-2]|uniref:tRNA uracil 4-sulfurtransferase ThiI n=1 Tax=Cellulosilyticum sp. WCF-2 TaxID=2497860 RepID=UPI000F8E822A|nr:tRNA uracil 4-sulfurtransferase ThiI [Cellulosilyticum sp. WCF-2]QEH69239.1 tRNA 4-thiouridine(8) synthase ThiI [Cellulosilyticum sp. WCF-2]
MKNVFLIKYGELAIKGKNRHLFENKLVANIKKNLKTIGEFVVSKEQGRIMVEPVDDAQIEVEQVLDRLSRIFGIIGIAYGLKEEEVSFEAIKRLALMQMQQECADGPITFKVETKRADKRFPMNSMEISAEIGGYLLDKLGDKAKVDVRHPDVTLMVELRNHTYVYAKTHKGAGGMPYGTNGKATLLLSGGIDSPVAGWMIAKRGVEVDAVYFHAPPYTSDRAKEKVVDLAKKVAIYTGNMKLHIINFTDIQLKIYERCPHEQLTLIMRRIMMYITEAIAKKNGSMGLITGESIGQVASQTMQSLVVTDDAATMPVFRPLIGFDKEEIVQIAKKIDTFETSILPYEDCCTIFVAKHPETKPKLEYIERSEALLDDIIEEMMAKAIEEMEIIHC